MNPLFRAKRALLTPYVQLMRRMCRGMSPEAVAILEALSYRPAVFLLHRRLRKRPDLLHEASLGPSSVVLDLGGFTGDWSARIVEKYAPTVYLFEPNPVCSPALAERFATNPKVRCFSYGIHSTDTSMDLRSATWGATVFPEGVPPGLPATRVKLRDVEAVLEELGIGEIDFVKMNIEGGEYDVLERLIESGRLASIHCLLVQFHEWRDGSYGRRRKIRRALRKSHRLEWDYPFIWEKWTRR